ncbi:hypothetical protein Lal_00038046 [Lupinus albus]|nr:hypothetical protein Lal_00038046 [Lupinus albus]
MYKSLLRGPHYRVQGESTKVGSFSVENRLLHYLIAYIPIQRNTNHAQPIINDLKLMLLAYGIFISRVIDHLGIDKSDGKNMNVNFRQHLVGDNLIHKISIYKYGAQWMYQEDYNTTIDLELTDEEEDANQAE